MRKSAPFDREAKWPSGPLSAPLILPFLLARFFFVSVVIALIEISIFQYVTHAQRTRLLGKSLDSVYETAPFRQWLESRTDMDPCQSAPCGVRTNSPARRVSTRTLRYTSPLRGDL